MKLPKVNKYAAGYALIGFAVARVAWERDFEPFDWGGELVTVGLGILGAFLILKG